jgi:hypothetical protein
MDASASFVVAAGADIEQLALSPHGVVAQEIFELWTLLAAVAVGAYIVVLALTAVALFRPRRRTAADERTGTRWIVIGGLGVPAMAVGAARHHVAPDPRRPGVSAGRARDLHRSDGTSMVVVHKL